MTVRLSTAQLLPAQGGATQEVRPEYDWVDAFEGTRGDLSTWFYPWGGVGAFTPLAAYAGRGDDIPKAMHGTYYRNRVIAASRALQTFTDLFYGRLHLDPSLLNLGNIVNEQTRKVEAWNANLFPITVTEVVKTGADGVDALHPGLPGVMQPLQVSTITVGVSVSGPLIISAAFKFKVTEVPPAILTVVGARSVVFSLQPNAARQYTEKLAWVSSLIVSQDGSEQRAAVNECPDTQLTFTVDSPHDAQRALRSVLWGWQTRVYSVPLWHRHSELVEPAFKDTVSLRCPTSFVGLRIGGVALVWADYDMFEAVEVKEIYPDRVVLARPLQRSWPKRAVILACRPARLPQELNLSWQNTELASATLTFVFTDVEQETPVDTGVSYRGLPTLLGDSNWASDLDEKAVTNIEIFETSTKARFTVVNSLLPGVTKAHQWWFDSADKALKYRQWLYSRRGRVVPFWAPSGKSDMVIVEDVFAGRSSIVITAINYGAFYREQPGRRDIAIILSRGQVILRRILASAEADGGREILTLDAEFEKGFSVKDVHRVSFLGLHRLDSDEVEIDWKTRELAIANQTMRLLTDVRQE